MRSKIWWVPAAISGLVATTHRTLATGPGGLAVTFDRPDPGKGETCIRLAAYPARRADAALEPPRLAHTLPHQDLLDALPQRRRTRRGRLSFRSWALRGQCPLGGGLRCW